MYKLLFFPPMGCSELVESVAIESCRGKSFKWVLYQMLKEQIRTFPSSIPYTMNTNSKGVQVEWMAESS